MNVIEAIHGRRLIHAYRSEPVHRGTIEDGIRDAVRAPTPPFSGPSPGCFCVVKGNGRIAGYGLRTLDSATTAGAATDRGAA